MWRERIYEAKTRGQFTQQDLWEAGVVTAEGPNYGYSRCAVGEQADLYGGHLFFQDEINRRRVLDDHLLNLGSSFAGAVAIHNFDKAEALLDQIEDRALEIKRTAQ